MHRITLDILYPPFRLIYCWSELTAFEYSLPSTRPRLFVSAKTSGWLGRPVPGIDLLVLFGNRQGLHPGLAVFPSQIKAVYYNAMDAECFHNPASILGGPVAQS